MIPARAWHPRIAIGSITVSIHHWFVHRKGGAFGPTKQQHLPTFFIMLEGFQVLQRSGQSLYPNHGTKSVHFWRTISEGPHVRPSMARESTINLHRTNSPTNDYRRAGTVYQWPNFHPTSSHWKPSEEASLALERRRTHPSFRNLPAEYIRGNLRLTE